MSVPKKIIPDPSEVPAKHHDKVIAHCVEQHLHGHYKVEQGSVTVSPIAPGRAAVSFVRVDDPSVTAQPHGLDLS